MIALNRFVILILDYDYVLMYYRKGRLPLRREEEEGLKHLSSIISMMMIVMMHSHK